MQASQAHETSTTSTGGVAVAEGVTVEQVRAAALASPWTVDATFPMRTQRISGREIVVLWKRAHEHEPFVVHRAYPGEGPERALLQGGGYHATLAAAQRDYAGR